MYCWNFNALLTRSFLSPFYLSCNSTKKTNQIFNSKWCWTRDVSSTNIPFGVQSESITIAEGVDSRLFKIKKFLFFCICLVFFKNSGAKYVSDLIICEWHRSRRNSYVRCNTSKRWVELQRENQERFRGIMFQVE